jgi:RimJ/RimL family protein N-acetyltransferase
MNEVILDFDPSIDDAKYVVYHVQKDQEKTMNMLKSAPFSQIIRNMGKSDKICSIKIDNDPVAIVGLYEYPEEEDTGYVWCVSTEHARKYPITYTKQVKKLLEEYCFRYSLIISYVDPKDQVYARWHEALGFVFAGEYTYTEMEGVTFLRFEYLTTRGLTNAWVGTQEESHE